MIHVKLGEEFRESLDKIKKYFPNSGYNQIVTNIINSYLPIYEQGMTSLHNPQLTIGRADAGTGITTSFKPPVAPYPCAEMVTKQGSSQKNAPEEQERDATEADEIPAELENLFD